MKCILTHPLQSPKQKARKLFSKNILIKLNSKALNEIQDLGFNQQKLHLTKLKKIKNKSN